MKKNSQYKGKTYTKDESERNDEVTRDYERTVIGSAEVVLVLASAALKVCLGIGRRAPPSI